MRKKFLIFTLCFTLIFSSLNYKKSYADVGVISLPVLATVSALAVGTGIVINNNEGLYELGAKFTNWVSNSNKYTMSSIISAFNASVALRPDNLVSVKSVFLDIVKEFFNDGYDKPVNDMLMLDYVLPIQEGIYDSYCIVKEGDDHLFKYYNTSKKIYVTLLTFNSTITHYYVSDVSSSSIVLNYYNESFDKWYSRACNAPYNTFKVSSLVGTPSFDSLNDRINENNDLSLPIPGNLGSLVGQNQDGFWSNTDDLVGVGGITLPSVDEPFVGVDSSVNTFPSVDDSVDDPSVPNTGIWSSIKEFIVSLVVPNDTFWTDTWGGLYNNFIDSFPMVDMTGFNDLVTGEKKFPNIDIDVMGVTGRVVNGDVVNSIVDWLRPIIAGFMMICLMLFNYRKIYKLIRNSEPFEGIGKVENHAN